MVIYAIWIIVLGEARVKNLDSFNFWDFIPLLLYKFLPHSILDHCKVLPLRLHLLSVLAPRKNKKGLELILHIEKLVRLIYPKTCCI
jgi:hypothetical protein